jgi:hypothetical protein
VLKPSVHGPIIDAAGFTERGWGGDIVRADNERRMFDAIEKAAILDPSGKIPVVLHSANGAPGREYIPDEKGNFKVQKITAVNLESPDRMASFEEDKTFYPTHPDDFAEGGSKTTVEEHLESANRSDWKNKMTDLATFAKHADEIIRNNVLNLGEYEDAVILSNPDGKTKRIVKFEDGKEVKLPNFSTQQHADYQKLREADIFLSNVELNFNSAFHKAYKYVGDENDPKAKEKREALDNLAKTYSKAVEGLIEKIPVGKGKFVEAQQVWNPKKKSDVLEGAIRQLQSITNDYGAPKLYEDAEDFAMKKATEILVILLKNLMINIRIKRQSWL